jgi:hypothetical protein
VSTVEHPTGAVNGRRVVSGREHLLPQHVQLITESAIHPDVALARGYRSVTDSDDLRDLGFSAAQARTPALLVPIYGPGDRRPVLYQARPDNPRERGGKPIKYETPSGAGMRLDVPPAAQASIGDPSTPLWVTEGVRKADAAVSAGACCLAVIGVWNWRGRNEAGGKTFLADWEHVALNDSRAVFLAFDSDAVDKRQVHDALGRLKAVLERRGAGVRVVRLPPAGETKIGLDDYLYEGGTLDELVDGSSPQLPPLTSGNGNGPTQATQLVQLAEEAGVELFHTPAGEPFATVPVDSHRETMALSRGAAGLGRWLARSYHQAGKGAAGAQVLQDALNVLEAKAMFDGPELSVFTRVAAPDPETVYIDLGDASWRAVEVRPSGWRLTSEPAVRFRRARGLLALPDPVAGGSINRLRPFINVADEDGWALLLAWTAGAYAPAGPYPVLSLHGEQGSAKSTTARILRALIDPNTAPLRAEPRDVRELMISATNSWCLALDNLSGVPPWLSDALCRLSTGGGFATRELRSDSDEIIFDAQRPVLLTGIEELATRSDLLDRALLLDLPSIAPESVCTERELWQAFEIERPRIFGALLDAIAAALTGHVHVELAQLPRMADFAQWAVAAEDALDLRAGSFMAAYAENRNEANEIALEGSPIGEPLRALVAQGPFAGTMSELLEGLSDWAGEQATRRRGWPKSPRALGGQLKRVTPNLNATGIQVARDERGRGRAKRKIVRLTASPGFCSPTCPTGPDISQKPIVPGDSRSASGARGAATEQTGPQTTLDPGAASRGSGAATGPQRGAHENPHRQWDAARGARGAANPGTRDADLCDHAEGPWPTS